MVTASAEQSTQFLQTIKVISNWLSRQLNDEQVAWLTQKQSELLKEATQRSFFIAFSLVPRRLGKANWISTSEDLKIAAELCPGWQPQNWRIDQLARTLLVLSLIQGNPESAQSILDQLFSAADIDELVALYQTLPLLPKPEQYQDRAAEGIRTNMSVVFKAVALDNPYPSQYLSEGAWNQMVLKAIFIDCPLYDIMGLDDRTNPALSQILLDYAHERWAASRSVTPELWRSMGAFTTDEMSDDLQRVLDDSDPKQQVAAAITCSKSNSQKVRSLLESRPELTLIAQQQTWETWTQKYLSSN
ncbi:MAG: EboA family metabolite traffic protein [Cyanobacteriota bacterium]|nr:EboA family metabolite traffic protein [Cyanobacteriota bacterium]